MCIYCTGTSLEIIIHSSKINSINLAKEMSLNLISNNKIVSSNVLMQCGNLSAGIIVIPNVPFQYQLTGYDINDHYFSKTKKTVLNTQIKANMCELSLPVPHIATISTVTTSGLTSKHISYAHTDSLSLTTPMFTSSYVITDFSKTNIPHTPSFIVTNSPHTKYAHTTTTTTFTTPISTNTIGTSTFTNTIATHTTPITSSSKSSFHCPCKNGGTCFTIVRFGRTHIRCRCRKGYSGSLCQSGMYIY